MVTLMGKNLLAENAKLTEIPDEMFKDRADITGAITIPDYITKVGARAFANTGITEVTSNVFSPEMLEGIQLEKFTGKYNIKMFHQQRSSESDTDIPDGYYIGGFWYRYHYYKVWIPSSLIEIYDIADDIDSGDFHNHESVKKITVLNAPEPFFANCRNLETVVLGTGIKKLTQDPTPDYVVNPFIDCPKLKTITYLGTMAEWNLIEKVEDWNRTDFENNTIRITSVICSDGTIIL